MKFASFPNTFFSPLSQNASGTLDLLIEWKSTLVENFGFRRRKSVSASFSAKASSSALRSSRTRPKFRRFFGTPKMGGWPRKRCCKNASIGIHARTSRLSDVEVSFQIRFFWTTTFQVTAPRHCKLYRHVYRNITPESNLHFWDPATWPSCWQSPAS